MNLLSQRLRRIRQSKQVGHMANITRGLEKESLRITPQGFLAKTSHPKTLGSALTHPRITTDYSEALLEFITPPRQKISESMAILEELHRFTYNQIGQEYLWINSMPCMITSDQDIPIAKYGSSNSAQMKTIYRKGLGQRYGGAMQVIAGIHYNFSPSDVFWQFLRDEDNASLPLMDYKTRSYLGLIRNFRRNFWILLYLFGAAPAVCSSFVKNRCHQLVPLGEDENSLHAPYATSLRMGDLGYQSAAQESLIVTYNCLEDYINSLCQAITQPYDEYRKVGIRSDNREYRQLNDCLLQIENEFYGLIRPKHITSSGQAALNALDTGGIEYIEVRCLDLNPFESVGVSESQIRFLDLFLMYCLLEDSPFSDEEEYRQQQENQRRMVYRGRDPDLTLYDKGKERVARQWGQEIIEQLTPIATMLDEYHGDDKYLLCLENEKLKLENQLLTPSARILDEVREQKTTFYRWAMNAAIRNREHFLESALSPKTQQYYERMAEDSLAKQTQLEAHQEKAFESFLADYYNQYQCRGAAQQRPGSAADRKS
jgi:glutamate--cysteine ligase